ncbi:DUF2147 domain-containing protein [Leeuwenhoekiella marinoflava]|uniref:DUF2147 domain-containing protein n=2 Tax=Leeuwenhoekiella marinoflava TaxID=988 RepID=A0A4Q0PQ10_9FLAO|nr:DUF2147 domain-containing protein [Leeuwenhoekiella marinoflava]RXG32679.1 putative protein (DUF2147 family) [Leeuwenhoekiella marinoflava]SHE53136.1 Uncharacterized conserved protein, DUF2147 family [Leeuwenhoekiella marinoflava DSM 3653]
MKKICAFLMFALISAAGMFAQDVTGKWKTIDDETGDAKSIVEIYKQDGKIYGKIIEILNKDRQDAKCVDCPGSDKGKPVQGLVIIKGLVKDGDEYNDGKILDPQSGKLYKCLIELENPDKLKVRGYIGFSLLGRTQYWARVK